MQVELQQFIQQAQYYQGALQELATMLPADDAALDALIAEAVTAGHQKEFVFVVMAALGANRPVQAGHLVHGAGLLPNYGTLGHVAWHVQGDVAAVLSDAIAQHVLERRTLATALFTIAAWCREYRAGVWPPELITQTRLLARQNRGDLEVLQLLTLIAALTNDAGLTKLLDGDGRHGQLPVAGALAQAEFLVTHYRGPITNAVCTQADQRIARGTTVRRSVARLSRNEPCHCGSGKKYKHCCTAKDGERLKHSSDVAGVTWEELAAAPEPHLTEERLGYLTPVATERLDPRKVPPDLYQSYFIRLGVFQLFDRVIEAIEQLGCGAPELQDCWRFSLRSMTMAGRKDKADQLFKLHPDAANQEPTLRVGTRLLLAQDDPPRYLALLEELALVALQTEDSDALSEFAYGLLVSKLPAVGIFTARSMIPLVEPTFASFLFKQILETRDKLKLAPDDPSSDVLDDRLAGNKDESKDEGKDAEALREAQDKLAAKMQEMQRYRDSVKHLEQELHRRERLAAATPATTATPTVPVDEAALSLLRQKVKELKSTLTVRHSERNELRRELQIAYSSLEELRTAAAPVADGVQAEIDRREDDLLLPEETVGQPPVRAIECPPDFQQTLRRMPPSVARGTMTVLGRLAAGEPAAFMGAIRLKACPDILRRRVGIDFRLLFRLLPDRVQVVDLLPRQDLERKIKTLVG